MVNLSNSLEELADERLKAIESRLTNLRKEILAILESSHKPLTTSDIADTSKHIAQSSLYRNLSVLIEAGLVTKIVNENDFAFFELDEHVLGHHHHLRCVKCGTVLDIELDSQIEKLLEKTSRTVSKKFKFTSVDHFLDYTGICESCSKK